MNLLAEQSNAADLGGFAEIVVEGCQRQVSTEGEVKVGGVVDGQAMCSAEREKVAKGASGTFAVNLKVESAQGFQKDLRIRGGDSLAKFGHRKDIGDFKVPMSRDDG